MYCVICMNVYVGICFFIYHIYVKKNLFEYCTILSSRYMFLSPTSTGWLEEISFRDKSTFVNLSSVTLLSCFILFLVK